MIKIAPSILSADFANLGEEIKRLEMYGSDFIHIDVMDGMFVPNISFGVPIIKSIRNLTTLPFDVHLMIEDPARYVEEFVRAGSDIITIHAEADNHLDRTIAFIKSLGIKAGIALNPATPVSSLKHVINEVDMVLIMSVNPGFGGQKYIHYATDKIKEVKELSNKSNPELLIEVDGGIDESNILEVAHAGANVIVAGSAIFKNGNIEENIIKLRSRL